MQLESLPSRPSASVLSVEDILRLAIAGKIRIPRFQTGLRWGAKNVEALFDSLLRGFPIGGLLLWKKKAPPDSLAFGPVQVEAPDRAEAFYVVDGQQRITSLVAALLHPDLEPLGGIHAVWVNLLDGTFKVCSEKPAPHWLPLNVIGDRRRLHQWARALPSGESSEKLAERAFEIETTLTKYELPAYIVEDASPAVLKLIFSRVNTYGVALTQAEVYQALFGDEQGAEEKPLASMANELANETLFGQLNPDWLLRCVKAVGGLDERREFGEEHRPGAARLLAHTREALRRSIQFLQSDARIVHSALLPYSFPLIVLAKLFHLYPTLHPRNRTLLVRWIWRGALSGVHTNSSHHAVKQHLSDLGQDEHSDVQRLLHRAPSTWEKPDCRAQWYGRAANTKFFATAMLQLDPTNPAGQVNEEREILHALNSRDLGELFIAIGDDTTNSIVNRVWWPWRRPARLWTLPPEVLITHGIDENARLALLATRARSGGVAEAWQTFRDRRAVLLNGKMDELIALLASPEENDRAPLQSLLAG